MDITIKVFRDDMVDALRNHGDALQSTMDSLDDGEIRDYFSEYILSLIHISEPTRPY